MIQVVVNQFAQYLDERGISKETITRYCYDIKRFLSIFPEDKRLSSYTTSDINHWISHERSRTGERTKHRLSIVAVNRSLWALRKFFKFLVDRGAIQQNPALQIDLLKQTKPLPHVLSREQVFHFLRGIPQRKQMDRLIFNLMYQAGLRISEVCNLKIPDIDFQASKMTIHGKGNKTRILPIEAEYLKPIKLYLNQRQPPSPDALIFLQPSGKSYTPRTLTNHFKRWAMKAKIEGTPHTLRHSFATHMLEAGFPITHIQVYLGHQSIATTQIYLHISDPELSSKYSRFSRVLQV